MIEVTMPEPKDKFSISMDPELVQRLDAIAEARDEARSTLIERIVRHGVADEEKFLSDMESPVNRVIAQLLTESPKITMALARLVGEQLTEEEVGKLRVEAERGKARQKKKRGSK
ncbi:ribbon-helix-helix protein, CopG family [Phycisphaerales bacterium AB-hyl4]|uniref:Ribbon-helix-helix protein, CopG family n=1 Tax=Natronomicrosphaera hydrolytica TaxID=3242702 RepID=A0ABV4UA51_9BACT